MQHFPALIKRNLYKRFRKAIEDYPADSSGKRFMQKALEKCPEDSIVKLTMAAALAEKHNIPLSSYILRLLQDKEGFPALPEICEELSADATRKAKDGSAEGYAERLGRRAFIKRTAAAGLGLVGVGELIKGGWVKSVASAEGMEKEAPEHHLNQAKIARVVAEFTSMYALFHSASTDSVKKWTSQLIQGLDPVIEQEIEWQKESADRQNARNIERQR